MSTALCPHCGQEIRAVKCTPTDKQILRSIRNAEILKDRLVGMKLREIADKWDLTQERVVQLLKPYRHTHAITMAAPAIRKNFFQIHKRE